MIEFQCRFSPSILKSFEQTVRVCLMGHTLFKGSEIASNNERHHAPLELLIEFDEEF